MVKLFTRPSPVYESGLRSRQFLTLPMENPARCGAALNVDDLDRSSLTNPCLMGPELF